VSFAKNVLVVLTRGIARVVQKEAFWSTYHQMSRLVTAAQSK